MFYLFCKKNKFSTVEINNILENSRMENKVFLSDVINIKNISMFEACYLMSKFCLNRDKINFIKLMSSQYEKKKEISQKETYSEYLFNIIKNLEKFDKLQIDFDIRKNDFKTNYKNISKIVDGLMLENLPSDDKYTAKYRFTTICAD